MGENVVIGIDFGTTFSCVGVWSQDHVEIISNEQGNRVTPSLVAFTQEERLIGDEAASQIVKNPAGTISVVKRLIGRTYAELESGEELKNLSYRVVEKDSKPLIEIDFESETKSFAPELIAGMILEKMKRTAEDFLGQQVKDCVVAAPAHFSDTQRQSLHAAAAIAKLNIVRIVNEPTAAALAYGFQTKYASQEEKRVLIFDLGGGTFDVTILTLAGGVYEVKTTTGEGHLGGEDFDARLAEHFRQEFKKKTKLDVAESKKAMRRLRIECERVKRILSMSQQAKLEVDSLYEGTDFFTSITRARFEDLCADLFKKIIDHVAKAVADSGLEKSKIDEVVLVGGSSRIPKIQQMLADFFEGKELCKSINPDEAIAFGAAVQGAILSGAQQQVLKEAVVLDILPVSIGVESSKGVMTTIIKRKSTIPTKRSMIFSTIKNNQENVLIKVYEGERAKTKSNKLIGQFELAIEPRPRGIPQIEITLEINASGVLELSALDRATGKSDGIKVTKFKGHLSFQEIEDMVIAAESYRIEDEKFKEKLEARNELFAFISTIANSIEEQQASRQINADDYNAVQTIIDEVMSWADDHFEDGKDVFTQRLELLRQSLIPYLTKSVPETS